MFWRLIMFLLLFLEPIIQEIRNSLIMNQHVTVAEKISIISRNANMYAILIAFTYLIKQNVLLVFFLNIFTLNKLIINIEIDTNCNNTFVFFNLYKYLINSKINPNNIWNKISMLLIWILNQQWKLLIYNIGKFWREYIWNKIKSH
jgi:hypothetical protein